MFYLCSSCPCDEWTLTPPAKIISETSEISNKDHQNHAREVRGKNYYFKGIMKTNFTGELDYNH